MLENGEMTDLAKKFDQLYVKLSLELNMIEINRFFSTESVVNKIELGIKRDPMGSENVKKGLIPGKFHTTFKYGSATSPSPPNESLILNRIGKVHSHKYAVAILC